MRTAQMLVIERLLRSVMSFQSLMLLQNEPFDARRTIFGLADVGNQPTATDGAAELL